MTVARALPAAIWALAAAGQGTTPKPKPGEYPARADTADATLAAEYMVHSFGDKGRTFVVDGYLTVEVALYPKPGAELKVDAGRFSLRINGRKQAIVPQAPGMVAAALKYEDLDRSAGRYPTAERFPGDPRARSPLPAPPRAPDSENRSGMDRPEATTAADTAVAAALPEGPARGPVSGFLYFASREKPAKIKSLELLYEGVALKLK